MRAHCFTRARHDSLPSVSECACGNICSLMLVATRLMHRFGRGMLALIRACLWNSMPSTTIHHFLSTTQTDAMSFHELLIMCRWETSQDCRDWQSQSDPMRLRGQ